MGFFLKNAVKLKDFDISVVPYMAYTLYRVRICAARREGIKEESNAYNLQSLLCNLKHQI